jgi:excisionase family DNA binding protein
MGRKSNVIKKNDDYGLPQKALFRVDEVSAYFNVARSTIYLWIDHGILSAEKYGGTIRIARDAIIACRFNNQINPLD